MILHITYAEVIARRTERFVGPNGVNVAKDVQSIAVEFLQALEMLPDGGDDEDVPDSAYYETVMAPDCAPGDTLYVPIVRYDAGDGSQVGRWCFAMPRAFLKREDAEAALKNALDATYSRSVRPWEGMYERIARTHIASVQVA